ncbi:MAG: hypothetical protein WA919_06955 [Coleofasciculaceae cyanobacterium]
MKQYLKLFIQLMASLLVMMSATISAAQAEEVWLDFSVSDAQISISETPSSELQAAQTTSSYSSSQLAYRETEKKTESQSILLDFSVPQAEVDSVETVTKIPQETKPSQADLPKVDNKLQSNIVDSENKENLGDKAPSTKSTPSEKQSTNSVADKVVQIAKDRIGTKFNSNIPAQCAIFVRDVFQEANLEVAVSKQPFDKNVQWIDAHPARAQSFFGSDVGLLITKKEDLQPGDLVGFQNTYGNWKKGAITHVGIVVERKDNGQIMMVDRSTRSSPVYYRPISKFKFAVGVRPYVYGNAQRPTANSLTALRKAIIGQESAGNFQIVNPDSGALGYGQVMPENVAPWTKAALGKPLTPEEFLANPDAQIKTIDHKLNEYLKRESDHTNSKDEELAVRRIASTWYSGKPELWNDAKPQYSNGQTYPSIKKYTASVWKRYLREIG